MTDTTAKIAQLNDECRKGWGGRIYVTAGIAALPDRDRFHIMLKVATYDEFTPENDPYGERDFGAIDHNGQRVFWKIDYYAADMTHGSERPEDPEETRRVLTIMLASEY